MKAFTVMGRTIKGAYEEFFLVVGLSLVFWAGTLLVVTSAATLLLTLLGFFGLNPRALTAWGIQLWQRLGRGSKEG